MAQKKYRLYILDPAQEELEEIAILHMELVGLKSARKITDRLYSAMGRLYTHPRMGAALEDEVLRGLGYRKLVCGNYLCFYRLIGEAVFVYHIADGRSDYKHLFHTFPKDEPQTTGRRPL